MYKCSCCDEFYVKYYFSLHTYERSIPVGLADGHGKRKQHYIPTHYEITKKEFERLYGWKHKRKFLQPHPEDVMEMVFGDILHRTPTTNMHSHRNEISWSVHPDREIESMKRLNSLKRYYNPPAQQMALIVIGYVLAVCLLLALMM
jgi:hypothetical protein